MVWIASDVHDVRAIGVHSEDVKVSDGVAGEAMRLFVPRERSPAEDVAASHTALMASDRNRPRARMRILLVAKSPGCHDIHRRFSDNQTIPGECVRLSTPECADAA